MKNTIIFTFALIISILNAKATTGSGDKEKKSLDTTVYLEIHGKIEVEKSTDHDYRVELIEGNEVVQNFIGGKDENFVLSLDKNKYYAIRIYKNGYATKFISVNTHVDDEERGNGYYRFNFIADMISESEFALLDQEAKDFPVAIIQFDFGKDLYDYNKKYTRNIKKWLYTGKRYNAAEILQPKINMSFSK
jgi:hypothetical protein